MISERLNSQLFLPVVLFGCDGCLSTVVFDCHISREASKEALEVTSSDKLGKSGVTKLFF